MSIQGGGLEGVGWDGNEEGGKVFCYGFSFSIGGIVLYGFCFRVSGDKCM